MSRFDTILSSYSERSDRIDSVLEDDFWRFPFRDDTLLWDQNRHIGMMNRHNYALLFWLDYVASTRDKPVLIHVDRHKDLEDPDQPLDISAVDDPEYVANYVDSLRVNEFIKPPVEQEIFEDVSMFGASNMSSFEELVQLADSGISGAFIFDLDLDVFQRNPLINDQNASHRNVISHRTAYELFADLLIDANLSTVCFSPDYQDGKSRETIQKHFTNLVDVTERMESSEGLVSRIRNFF
jgi:hypothetical protein